jgi:hypothetical protein
VGGDVECRMVVRCWPKPVIGKPMQGAALRCHPCRSHEQWDYPEAAVHDAPVVGAFFRVGQACNLPVN